MRVTVASSVLWILVACSGTRDAAPSRATPTGGATVSLATARTHAHELDVDVGHRPAGSQEEQAASVYITAHLQQAGYVVFLDAVPVADLVRSTNVVARPPSGEAPRVVVVAAYDSPRDGTNGGGAVGMLLELARALRVRVPDHDVQFVALGAEHAAAEGGRLGSRRLAQDLSEADVDPFVIALAGVDDDFDCVFFAGPGGGELENAVKDRVRACGGPLGAAPEETAEVFDAAGFDAAEIAGDSDDVAEALMQFLVSRGPVGSRR